MAKKTPPQPRYWRSLERHPLSAEYDDITGTTWERYVDTLKQFGILRKRTIVIHESKVIDGWQLYRGCLELNLKPVFEELELPEEMAVEAWVEAVNDLRRHETQEMIQKRAATRRGRVAEARQEGQSIRQIAETEDVSIATVQRDLAGVSGDTPAPPSGKVTGADNKKYDAQQPDKPGDQYEGPIFCSRCKRFGRETPKPGEQHCADCVEARKKPGGGKGGKPTDNGSSPPKKAPDATVDNEGEKLPSQALEAFAAVKAIKQWCQRVNELVKEAAEFIKGPAGRLMSLETVKSQLASGKGNVWANLPSHVCPYCTGKDKKCEVCKGQGWVAKHIWSQAPKKAKK